MFSKYTYLGHLFMSSLLHFYNFLSVLLLYVPVNSYCHNHTFSPFLNIILYYYCYITMVISFIVIGGFCHLLITFANFLTKMHEQLPNTQRIIMKKLFPYPQTAILSIIVQARLTVTCSPFQKTLSIYIAFTFH